MTAPGPLNGPNPFTAGYQKRQFKVESVSLPGSNAVHGSLTGPQNVFDALVSPPTTGTAAVTGSDPLAEEADVATTPQPGIEPD
jgi:hypothetical protein